MLVIVEAVILGPTCQCHHFYNISKNRNGRKFTFWLMHLDSVGEALNLKAVLSVLVVVLVAFTGMPVTCLCHQWSAPNGSTSVPSSQFLSHNLVKLHSRRKIVECFGESVRLIVKMSACSVLWNINIPVSLILLCPSSLNWPLNTADSNNYIYAGRLPLCFCPLSWT